MISTIFFIGLCIAFAIQLFYILYFFLPFVNSKDDQNVTPTQEGVSVIVSAWDELDNLKVLVPLLLSQNHPNFDLIIVDDRSTDGSLDYLRELSQLDRRIKHIRIDETPVGMSAKKYALTLAIKASKHEKLIFTDADCLPDSNDWITSMSNGYTDANKQVVLGYSKYLKKPGFLNKFIRYETAVTALQYFSFALKGRPYMGVGRNLSYTRSIFLNNNGFQPYMSFLAGDDDLFVQKVATPQNTSIVTKHCSHTISIPKNTWDEYLTQKVRHLNIGKYYNFKTKSLLGLLFLSTLFFYICFVFVLFNKTFLPFALGFIFLRLLLNVIVFYKLSKKLNDSQEWYLTPMLEFLYLLYYIVVGFISLNKKKISWK
ncbi:MAG TPA: glycosyltransferase [Cytophagales bacterium]|nr:glycosyltransferase [Cytophagales bacterium]